MPNAFVGNLGRPAGGREGIARPSVALDGLCAAGRAAAVLFRSVPEREGRAGKPPPPSSLFAPLSSLSSLPFSLSLLLLSAPKVRAGTAGAERRVLSSSLCGGRGVSAGVSAGNVRAGTLGGTGGAAGAVGAAGRGHGVAPSPDTPSMLFVTVRLRRSSSGFSHVTSSVRLFQ